MIKVIALDEMGQFENRISGIRLVGGYTVSVWDYEDEMLKIESCLKEFCQEFNQRFLSQYPGINVYYPQSLHGSGKTLFRKNGYGKPGSLEAIESKGDLAQIERTFRVLLEEKTVSYLRKRGARLYAYLDPFVGESEEARERIGGSNMLNTSYGANFYERMATLSVFNQTFFAVDQDCGVYSFEIATRTLDQSGDEWEALYEVYQNSRKQTKSTITNTSTYKTAVSAMLYSGSVEKCFLEAEYRFHVKPINYSSTSGATPYLYLADVVCGYLRRKFQQVFSVDIHTVENRIDSDGLLQFCADTGIEVRTYDQCDAVLRQMVQAIKACQLAQYYSLKYELLNRKWRYQDFYAHYWLPKMEAYIQRMLLDVDYREKVKSRIPEYVAYADGFMGTRDVSYEQGLYVAEELCRLVSELNDYHGRKNTLFRLYDIALRGYNHRGAVIQAQRCISKCEEYKSEVGVEEYVAHSIRTLGLYFNAMRYADALSSSLMLEETVIQLKQAYTSVYRQSSQISKAIAEGGNRVQNAQFPIAGKLFSSIGQAYAFQRQYSPSKKYFLKALKEFEKNSTNYTITLGHFLQLLISHKKKADYEIYSQIYFGRSDLWGQMEQAYSAEDGGFALLIFVKAFHVFYARDKGNVDILQELVSRICAGRDDHEHPWELIYKNLYEAMSKHPKAFRQEERQFIKERTVSCIDNADATIKAIQILFRLQHSDIQRDLPAVLVLDKDARCVCNQFFDDVDNLTVEEVTKKLSELLVYAYE